LIKLRKDFDDYISRLDIKEMQQVLDYVIVDLTGLYA
jgi:hypothetical protein